MRVTLTAFAATTLLLLLLIGAKRTVDASPGPVQASANTRIVTGPAIAITHGLVQVVVTVRAGKIVDVAAVRLPHDNAHSWHLSVDAAPILRSEALSSQSADVDVVSGATYTSQAYARSLQAALDRR
jgi:uncharacterized protein with FMN-binding domain